MNRISSTGTTRYIQSSTAARESGFTLLELAIALAIGATVVSILGSVLIGSTNSLAYIMEDCVALEDIDDVVNGVRDELRESRTSSITINTGSLNDTVTLQQSQDGGAAMVYGADDQYGNFQTDWSIRYQVSGSDLLREVLNTSGNVQSSGIVAQGIDITDGGQKGFSVIRNGNLYVVLVTINKSFPDGNGYSKTMQSTVRVMN